MKKQITLSLCLLFSAAGYSQNESSDKKFHLGLVGSGGLGWVSPESKNIEGSGGKAGISFGVFGDFYFAKNYAFSVEVNHSTQGFKIKADSISITTGPNPEDTKSYGNVEIDYRIRSFQVPISLKLRTNEIGYMHYYGQLGIVPSFAYKAIRADYSLAVFPKADDNTDRPVNEVGNDFNYGTISEDIRTSFLEEDNISGFRMPLLIGAGAEWTISGNTALLFGIRYEYGLINMMKAEDAIARRNTINLLVGVRF